MQDEEDNEFEVEQLANYAIEKVENEENKKDYIFHLNEEQFICNFKHIDSIYKIKREIDVIDISGGDYNVNQKFKRKRPL